jgi:hypothetical protein
VAQPLTSATSGAVELSLVSHTNAGKTTLARTLLRRDIGEVGDRAHVTELAERHVLVESPQGDVLALWDTPGFGDSARLLARLKRSNDPLGWLLSQVWDRVTNRPFWSNQQAIRNAREHSDVLLYVVNAAEAPADAGYVTLELQILDWIGKPVLVLLNQLGATAGEVDTSAEAVRWCAHLTAHPCVRGVLSLDAFARCWVHEEALLREVQVLLPSHKQAACERLRGVWNARNVEVFERSMRVLAEPIARAAIDHETFAEADVQNKVRGWVQAFATGKERTSTELALAQQTLVARLDASARAATDAIVHLHGLSGRAAAEQLQQLGREFAVDLPADQHTATALGSILSGAASGLAADLAAGGLSFGAGALIGGLLGALGGRGLAAAYNVVRGSDRGVMRWSAEFTMQRVTDAVLRYLAPGLATRSRLATTRRRSRTRLASAASSAWARVRIELTCVGRPGLLTAHAASAASHCARLWQGSDCGSASHSAASAPTA